MKKLAAVCVFLCALAALSAHGQTATAPSLLPVPDVAAQARAQQMIHELYKTSFAKTGASDRKALAKLLVAQARETTDDAAARYAALSDAADLAAGAGDAATTILAIDELARTFAVNVLELKRTALTKAHAATVSAAESEEAMRLAMAAADQAAAADEFQLVITFTGLAESAANKTQQVKTVASIQIRLAELRGLAEEFKQVKAAQARLENNPDDADAHLVIGRFYALHKGQWPQGLSHLASGSNIELRELAEREIAKPTDGLAQTALGDAWWAYADKSSGLTRPVVFAHAREWYKQAEQSIKGITLVRIQSRLQSGPGAPEVTNVTALRTGVDVLALIDTAKDVAQGSWNRTAMGLACESSAYACLQIPFTPPEEYVLQVSFTRVDGAGPIALLLTAQKHGFGFALDVKGEARFERVDGKVAQDNPTTVPVAVSNGRRYALSVEVRKDKVRAFLDGKLLTEWKTDYRDLSRYSVWRLGDGNTLCGIGANNAKVMFHSIEVLEVSGRGKPTR